MDDPALAFEAQAVGRSCRVVRREADWVFDLQDDTGLVVGCHWRLISPSGIALTDEDDGERFGLSDPVNAESKANALLSGATVTSATIDRLTADLRLQFSNDLRLEVVNNSSGYEGWEVDFTSGGKAATIVAMGGGGLTVL